MVPLDKKEQPKKFKCRRGRDPQNLTEIFRVTNMRQDVRDSLEAPFLGFRHERSRVPSAQGCSICM